MGIAFHKVWRDLWNHKGRTLLVVFSISIGVLAVGMIVASNTLLARQMTLSHQASHPSHATLFLNSSIDDNTLRSLARLPGIAEIDGWSETSIRWKPTLDGEWQTATLIALSDYRDQKFDFIELSAGRWPDEETVAVEFNHVLPYNLPASGNPIYFEVNDRAKPLTLSGLVRDPQQLPPPFTYQPAFYITRDTLKLLGLPSEYAQLRFTVPTYSKQQVELAASAIEAKLDKLEVTVGLVRITDPQRHALQDIIDGLALILTVMAFLSLGLGTTLVINTVNAVIAQQIPQIGLMKTVGGLTWQIATLYLAGVVVYCLLSLLLAVPLGALGGDLLARWILTLFNAPAAPFEILRLSLFAQILAGLLIPILAALWPILRGASISVCEALNSYGVDTSRYGASLLDRALGRVRGLPSMLVLMLRNTFRRVGRAALIEITLTAAGAIFMMVSSTHNSFRVTFEKIFESFGADVVIEFEQPQRIDEIVPMIQTRPNVAQVEMWVWTAAKARVPGANGLLSKYEVLVRGIPADSELFTPNLAAGRALSPSDDRGLLLNQKLARKMGLGVGDQVELELGGRKSVWLIVGLIYDLTGQDQNTAYLDRDALNEEMHWVGRATVAEIRATAHTPEAQVAIEKDLRRYFESLQIGVNYTETALASQQTMMAQFDIIINLLLIMTFMIAIVGSVGLSGALSINVLERRREIGVMRTVGASSGDIGIVFVGEGLLLGILSWAQAVPISILAGRYFVDAIGSAINFPATYYYSVNGVWLWLGIVAALSLVASWVPAQQATHISVRESLAYE